ncbi:MAG: hypothetical protein ACTSSC_11150, partial [Promethearchaeota archaeon]
MKRIVKPTSTSKQSIPKTPIMPGKTEENSEPQGVNLEPSKEQLTPIPFVSLDTSIDSEKPDLTPIPKKKPKIS